jgi:hypothetical protein
MAAPKKTPDKAGRKGLLGRKVGMTQIFDSSGAVVPVTVIEAGPCPVTMVRSAEQSLAAGLVGSLLRGSHVDRRRDEHPAGLHALRPIASLSFTLEAVGYGSVRSNLRTLPATPSKHAVPCAPVWFLGDRIGWGD